ncbi:hypothetical protein BDZ45DRAFT_667122 [Acephala macrosclerotiorum]|nr:hypothetical protein BDZ45DRAFT_667122 [Acephala macrosclerotiorum]
MTLATAMNFLRAALKLALLCIYALKMRESFGSAEVLVFREVEAGLGRDGRGFEKCRVMNWIASIVWGPRSLAYLCLIR